MSDPATAFHLLASPTFIRLGALERLRILVAACRPPRLRLLRQIRGGAPLAHTQQIDAVLALLARNPELRLALQTALAELLRTPYQASCYAESGLLPERSFWGEGMRRLTHNLLPDVPSTQSLRDVLGQVFTQRADAQWVCALAPEQAQQLVQQLLPPEAREQTLAHVRNEMLDALQVLTVRIAAAGCDGELARMDEKLLSKPSDFAAQQQEFLRWRSACAQAPCAAADSSHLMVLWDQCRTLVGKLHRRAGREGTSLHLSQLLLRLNQQLARVELLVHVLQGERHASAARWQQGWTLFCELLAGEVGKNSVRQFVGDTTSLMALRVTDNAARSGEHYITETRADYRAMLTSALGAGPVIATMALLKFKIAALHLPPLTEALLTCLNYGLGFVLIHMLGLTIATKQPAMTAAAIGSAIRSSANDKQLSQVALLIARTTRSQLAAVLGNVGLALPSAIALSYYFWQFAGTRAVTPAKTLETLQGLHPFASGALVFAAIAGVCLFLAGLIAGYADNLAAYGRIPQRVAQWLRRRRLGSARVVQAVESYIDHHFGALVGNFAFGFLLGGTSALGYMTGLPLDIRHIAFSSAHIGYALAAFDFSPPWAALLWACLGVALVGMVNLVVSFSLALWLAFRARGLAGVTRYGRLLRSVAQLFRSQPRMFFLPPPVSAPLKSYE